MADNIIKVNVTANKSQRVTVSSANVGTEITASSDTGKFWAQTSKNWAVSENIVDGEDYSSKYYANKSKGYAQNAESFEAATRETYDNIIARSEGIITEIEDLKEISEQEISVAVADGLTEINKKKNTAISDLEFVSEGEKEEIKELVDTGKDELKEAIGDVKVLTTLEIGDIGIAPLGIDETKGKRRYLNGQLIIQEQYVQFTNKVKSAVALYPSLACTESEWQTTATMTVGGQVGKFVVDDEAGTIRLPKIIMPIQGLTDLSKLGEIVEAGLPNIIGNTVRPTYGSDNVTSGAFYATSKTYGRFQGDSGGSWYGRGTGFDASLSNPIYNNSETVQQEQIQYPYFIQVATGAEVEDNIINEIELNNPFSLLDYKYSEYELNNISWLRSNGQYNSNVTYPAVYDLLLKIYNGTETKAGVSVKLSTETYTDYDFVLNTAEETFRLPIKVKLASGKAVVGNGMALGLLGANGVNGALSGMASSYNPLGFNIGSYGDEVGSTINGYSGSADISDKIIGITTDPTKSGIETSDSDLYLYFYVGETVQNANLINVGRIQEKVAECITRNDCLAYVTATYVNGKSWYRVYSDGWCVQGGVVGSDTGNYGTMTVNLLKSFKDTNYTLVASAETTVLADFTNTGNCSIRVATFLGAAHYNKTKNSFDCTTRNIINWRACGYIA